jgi:hypothetical protein
VRGDFQRLIDQAHADVNKYRAKLGLQPWVFKDEVKTVNTDEVVKRIMETFDNTPYSAEEIKLAGTPMRKQRDLNPGDPAVRCACKPLCTKRLGAGAVMVGRSYFHGHAPKTVRMKPIPEVVEVSRSNSRGLPGAIQNLRQEIAEHERAIKAGGYEIKRLTTEIENRQASVQKLEKAIKSLESIQ